MISSMTGYGKGNAALGAVTIQVEIKTLNHRFCDVSVKAPRGLLWLENDLRRKVSETLLRGKADVFISQEFAGGGESLPQWNRALACRYMEIFSEMKKEFRLEGEIPLSLLAAQKDIILLESALVDTQEMKTGVGIALEQALAAVQNMRRTEGAALSVDLWQRLDALKGFVDLVAEKAPLVPGEWRQKLLERLQRLAADLDYDPQRAAQEVALFADRCDISEEISRLRSHFSQFSALLESSEAVGRQLDFLVQEMGREINTIGSKGNDSDLSRLVVLAKAELEKIREQVQNVV
ncbi:MAG: YicC family protein [Deltaproteobacteria bacterium]|nr:YicC family protein [Deltaproteobacteria bacterium]